jgi:hypothetical protein
MKAADYLSWYRLEIHAHDSGNDFFAQIYDAGFDKALWESPWYPTLDEAYAAGRKEWEDRCETDREAAAIERAARLAHIPRTQEQIAQDNGVMGY